MRKTKTGGGATKPVSPESSDSIRAGKYHLHEGDLPEGFVDSLAPGSSIAIDTEATGLHLRRDRLCLVQLATASGECHMVRVVSPHKKESPDSPAARPKELIKLLTARDHTKIFHFARFDIARLWASFGIMTGPVFCTKVASHLARTYSPNHGLGDLCGELLDVVLDKSQQSTDWGRPDLSSEQLAYAIYDVIYLHALAEKLELMLKREGRWPLAEGCFGFLPIRALLDAEGWDGRDVFAHKM